MPRAGEPDSGGLTPEEQAAVEASPSAGHQLVPLDEVVQDPENPDDSRIDDERNLAEKLGLNKLKGQWDSHHAAKNVTVFKQSLAMTEPHVHGVDAQPAIFGGKMATPPCRTEGSELIEFVTTVQPLNTFIRRPDSQWLSFMPYAEVDIAHSELLPDVIAVSEIIENPCNFEPITCQEPIPTLETPSHSCLIDPLDEVSIAALQMAPLKSVKSQPVTIEKLVAKVKSDTSRPWPIVRHPTAMYRFSGQERDRLYAFLAKTLQCGVGQLQIKRVYESCYVKAYERMSMDKSGDLVCIPKAQQKGFLNRLDTATLDPYWMVLVRMMVSGKETMQLLPVPQEVLTSDEVSTQSAPNHKSGGKTSTPAQPEGRP